MQAFLAYAGLIPQAGHSPLDTSLEVMRVVMAIRRTTLAVGRRRFPEICGGWYTLQPGTGPSSTFITDAVDDDIAVLAFGALFGGQQGSSLASQIATAWHNGGPTPTRMLDGCFGALLLDRRQRTLYLLSDPVGRRALRYYLLPDAILVSTHDLPIVATGLCAPDVDPVSAVSVIAFGWSIGANGLVRGIQPCDPNEFVRWRNGATERIWDPLIRTEGRLERSDSGGRRAKVDRMIALMRANTRRFLSLNSGVNVDVTAGIDSRTVLALGLSVRPRPPLTAVTAGRHSTDVRIARLLARLYRLPHETFVPDVENRDSFFENTRLLAYAMNGAANAKQAIGAPPNLSGRQPTLSGTGGEQHRGDYYCAGLGERELREKRPLAAAQAIFDRFVRQGTRRCVDVEWIRELADRHIYDFQRFIPISEVVSDLLDIFYLQERLGRWAGDARRFWLAPTFTPFESPQLFRLGFELAAPKSSLLLHKTVLRRYARMAFCVPVNARYLLPFRTHTSERSRRHQLLRSGLSVADKLGEQARRLASPGSVTSHDRMRSRFFQTLLPAGLGDLILEGNSLGLQIAHRDRLCTIIQEHVDGQANHVEIIGILATLEEYRRTLSEAAGAAKRIRGR